MCVCVCVLVYINICECVWGGYVSVLMKIPVSVHTFLSDIMIL